MESHAGRWLDNQALNYRHVADVEANELDQIFPAFGAGFREDVAQVRPNCGF